MFRVLASLQAMFGGGALTELLKTLYLALHIVDLLAKRGAFFDPRRWSLAEASWKSERANVSRVVTYQRLPRCENLSRNAAMSGG